MRSLTSDACTLSLTSQTHRACVPLIKWATRGSARARELQSRRNPSIHTAHGPPGRRSLSLSKILCSERTRSRRHAPQTPRVFGLLDSGGVIRNLKKLCASPCLPDTAFALDGQRLHLVGTKVAAPQPAPPAKHTGGSSVAARRPCLVPPS